MSMSGVMDWDELLLDEMLLTELGDDELLLDELLELYVIQLLDDVRS
jgi:hypothetical protein